ncbi:hypothetical protein ACOYR1_10500 [Thalassotalea piscium]
MNSSNKLVKEPWLFLNTLFLSSVFFFFGFFILSRGSTTIIGKREITSTNDPFLFYLGVFLSLGLGTFVVGRYIYLKYKNNVNESKNS